MEQLPSVPLRSLCVCVPAVLLHGFQSGSRLLFAHVDPAVHRVAQGGQSASLDVPPDTPGVHPQEERGFDHGEGIGVRVLLRCRHVPRIRRSVNVDRHGTGVS